MSEVNTQNPYPRMLWWEVTNFMSIEKGKCEFDDRNIINLKGYNDSGKSAMLTGLKVLLYNANPTKQASFIQDGKDYFRILAQFEDGVLILRDKYINGQSLYEMYKDGELLYSTKRGNALSRVTEVPEPIAEYLGLVLYDGVCLNARACFEKQIGVQTTGSENYKMFNTVLKSEEIATASTLINNDRNKLSSDIDSTDYELQAQKALLGTSDRITKEMVDYLKSHDTALDGIELQQGSLSKVQDIKSNLSGVVITPEIDSVDISQLLTLDSLSNQFRALSSIKVIPELDEVDTKQLELLGRVKSAFAALSGVVITPEVPALENSQLTALQGIKAIVEGSLACDLRVNEIDSSLAQLNTELEQLQTDLASQGVKMVRCPGCGQIFDPEQAHLH